MSTQVEEFREVFHEFDIDGDGTISIKVHLEIPPYPPHIYYMYVLNIVGLDMSTAVVVHHPVKITL